MKRDLLALLACAVALAANAQPAPYDPRVTFLLPFRVADAHADRHFVATPHSELTADQVSLNRYKTQSDFPRPDEGFYGNAITVPENGTGVIPRSDYAYATYLRNTRGGGYVLQPDGSYKPKEREQWIVRHSFIDPATNNELNVDDPTIYGDGDYTLEWERQTPRFHSCFTFYEYYCDTYGFDFDELPGLWVQVYPSCASKLSTQYYSRVFYRYSMYKKTADVPAGEQEWVPAEVPQTLSPLRLNKPGQINSEIQFTLGPREDAIHVGFVNSVINPQIPDTGGATIGSVPAGATDVVVTTSECNGIIPNVGFTLTSEQVEGSGGHVHVNSGDTAPPAGAFSNAPPSTSGTTDGSGRWQTRVTAGLFAGRTSFTASTPNIGLISTPIPMTSQPAGLVTGIILRDYVPHPLVTQYVKLTGQNDSVCGGELVTDPATGNQVRVYHCNNHRDSNHYVRPELEGFIENFASLYNDDPTIPAANKGRLGINDASLTLGGKFDIRGHWTGSHSLHRLGVDVDVDRSVFDANGNYAGALRIRRLTQIIQTQLGGSRVREVPIHYRLPGDIIDAIINDIRCDTCSLSTGTEADR